MYMYGTVCEEGGTHTTHTTFPSLPSTQRRCRRLATAAPSTFRQASHRLQRELPPPPPPSQLLPLSTPSLMFSMLVPLSSWLLNQEHCCLAHRRQLQLPSRKLTCRSSHILRHIRAKGASI